MRQESPPPDANRKESGMTRRRMIGLGIASVAAVAAGIEFLPKESDAPRKPKPEKNKPKYPEIEKHRYTTDEERIESEILYARDLLASPDPLAPLKSSYAVAALYYSDRFLAELSGSVAEDSDTSRSIIREIAPLVTPEARRRYVASLDEKILPLLTGTAQQRQPLPELHFGTGENHPDAIDLFAAEGTLITSIARGMVVLAEASWSEQDAFGTSSARGGNSVIVYNPDTHSFYRYCHLSDVEVRQEELLRSGQSIGKVGHTGMNASKPGHGEHLHLEINVFDSGTGHMDSRLAPELKEMLMHTPPVERESTPSPF